jgi:hypothetical protein
LTIPFFCVSIIMRKVLNFFHILYVKPMCFNLGGFTYA